MSGHGHFRALGRHPARLTGTLGGADGLWRRPARILDLSWGARLRTDAEVPAGASVRLSVESPNRWDPLGLPARVAWVHSAEGATELGLSFEPSPGTMRGLLDLVGGGAYD